MSNVTGSTTPSTGIINYVFNILYIMLIAQPESKPLQRKPVNQYGVEFAGKTFGTYLCTDLCFCLELLLWIRFFHTCKRKAETTVMLIFWCFKAILSGQALLRHRMTLACPKTNGSQTVWKACFWLRPVLLVWHRLPFRKLLIFYVRPLIINKNDQLWR